MSASMRCPCGCSAGTRSSRSEPASSTFDATANEAHSALRQSRTRPLSPFGRTFRGPGTSSSRSSGGPGVPRAPRDARRRLAPSARCRSHVLRGARLARARRKGQSLTFDVEGAVRGLSVREPRFARDAVRGMDLGVRARGRRRQGELRLDQAEASARRRPVDGARWHSQTPGTRRRRPSTSISDLELPGLLDERPVALLPTIDTARMDGDVQPPRAGSRSTRAKLDSTAFDYDVNDRCRARRRPGRARQESLLADFTHTRLLKDWRASTEETTGPGTRQLDRPRRDQPFMQVAVLTTEDGAFFHHHGFSHAAIRHALIADIKADVSSAARAPSRCSSRRTLPLEGEDARRASSRSSLLADYLEQTFTKDEMMELYLNIIEFGPDIYGVTAAAEALFRPTARRSSICSSAVSFVAPSEPDRVPQGLREGAQVERRLDADIHARMEVAAKNGLISPAELAEGAHGDGCLSSRGDPPPHSSRGSRTNPSEGEVSGKSSRARGATQGRSLLSAARQACEERLQAAAMHASASPPA